MTFYGKCTEVVLVEAPDGHWPRLCIDPVHPAGTDHHTCFRGHVLPWLHGVTRIHVSTLPSGDQPAAVIPERTLL